MKKLLLSKALLFLLLTITSYSQSKDNYMGFGIGFDVKNALIGSPATNNKSELNYTVQFIMVSNNAEIIVGYEGFPKLNFNKYSFSTGYHYRLYAYTSNREWKTTFIPSVEYVLINRYGNWGGGISQKETSSHLSIGLNLALRWNLNSKLSAEYCFNMLPRTDSSSQYGSIASNGKFSIGGVPIIGSNFIKIIWRSDITKRKL